MANTNNTKNSQNLNEGTNSREAYFIRKRKPIAIIIAVVVIVLIGGFAFNQYVSQPREDKASTELAKGQQLFERSMFETALNGDSASYMGFAKIAEEYSSTDAGNLANLYAGLCYANLGKWQEAEKYISGFSVKGDAVVSPAVMGALANVYANLKQYDKAVEHFKKAASMADSKSSNGINPFISPAFLLQAGEILESQNKKDEALEIYNEIKTKYYSNQYVASQIDKYIERVSVK